MLKQNGRSSSGIFLKRLSGLNLSKMNDNGRVRNFIVSSWNSIKPWSSSFSTPSTIAFYKRWDKFFNGHSMYNLDKLINFISSMYHISINFKIEFDIAIHHSLPDIIPSVVLIKKKIKILLKWVGCLPKPFYLVFRKFFCYAYTPFYKFFLENKNIYIDMFGFLQFKFFIYLLWYVPLFCFKYMRLVTRWFWIFFLKHVRSISSCSEFFWSSSWVLQLQHNVTALSDKVFVEINTVTSILSLGFFDKFKFLRVGGHTVFFYCKLFIIHLSLGKDILLVVLCFWLVYVYDWFVSLGRYDRHFFFINSRYVFLKKLVVLFFKKFRYLFSRHFFFKRNYIVGHGDFFRIKQGPRIFFKYLRHNYFVTSVNFKKSAPWGIDLVKHPKYWSYGVPLRHLPEYDPKYKKQLAVYLDNSSGGSVFFMFHWIIQRHHVWDNIYISCLKKHYYKYLYTKMWYLMNPYDILHSKSKWVPFCFYKSLVLNKYTRLAYEYKYGENVFGVFWSRKVGITNKIERSKIRWIKIYDRFELQLRLFIQRSFIKIFFGYFLYRFVHIKFLHIAVLPFIDRYSTAHINSLNYYMWSDKSFKLKQIAYQTNISEIPDFLFRLGHWPYRFDFFRKRSTFCRIRKKFNSKKLRLVGTVYTFGELDYKGVDGMCNPHRNYWRKGWRLGNNFYYFWFIHNSEHHHQVDWYLFFNSFNIQSNIEFFIFYM